jgi:hypothetical protein
MANTDVNRTAAVYDPCLIRLDKNGNVKWSRTFGEVDVREYADNLNIASDKGYVFVGRTGGIQAADQGDVYIVKTDFTGRTGCEKDVKFLSRDITLTRTDKTADIVATTTEVEKDHSIDKEERVFVRTDACKKQIICDDADTLRDDGPKNLVDDPTLDNSTLCSTSTPVFLSELVPYCNGQSPIQPNQYSLVYDANTLQSSWVGTDHTGGTSKMLVGKGPLETDKKIWYQEVGISSEAEYTLCLYFRNVCPTCPGRPSVEVKVGEDVIAGQDDIDFDEGWVNITGTYTPDSTDTTHLAIVVKGNYQPMAFALDDIRFMEITSGPGGSMAPALSLNKTESHNMAVKMYPNPVKSGDNLTLDYNSEGGEILHANMLDMTGKMLRHADFQVKAGTNRLTLSTANLAAGVYSIQLLTNDSVTTYKVTVIE